MKPSELKPGQLIGVHFPYAPTQEAREKKYGFRIVRPSEPVQYSPPNPDGWFVHAENSKTGKYTLFWAPDDNDLPNWTLIEDLQ